MKRETEREREKRTQVLSRGDEASHSSIQQRHKNPVTGALLSISEVFPEEVRALWSGTRDLPQTEGTRVAVGQRAPPISPTPASPKWITQCLPLPLSLELNASSHFRDKIIYFFLFCPRSGSLRHLPTHFSRTSLPWSVVPCFQLEPFSQVTLCLWVWAPAHTLPPKGNGS